MLHSVYFWLKPDLDSDQRQQFEIELARLVSLDYLAYGFAGKPAATEERPVTDHSFSYSLVLRFKTLEDHDFYQSECPVHKRFVQTCQSFWERVVVYDSESLV
jgi:hypothetical protein